MRVRLPFVGTLLESYSPGSLPTFDQADPMYPIDDALEGHGYMVVLDSFDFVAGTVEVEVDIPPLARVRLPDGSEVWENEIPVLADGETAVVIGQQSTALHAIRVAVEEAKITANVSGKTAADLRTESTRYSGKGFTDSRPAAATG